MTSRPTITAAGATPAQAAAMLLVTPALVPSGWRARAVPFSAIWLDADEVDTFAAVGEELPEDVRVLVPLLLGGFTVNAIADRLHVSPRTVHRRLGRLRRLVGARSHAELVALLVQRGTGEEAPA